MTGQINLDDTLTHEAYIEQDEDAPTYQKILISTVNWSYTNRQGMTFAMFIAACFLTLFKYIPPYRTKNRFLNSFYGMVTGTPLGVCVNCVAPIAKAMYEGGRSTQTALAVMFSSPTLNIIVLTMLFTFFPPYIALIKLATTFLLILGIVPFLSHERKESLTKNDSENEVCEINLGNLNPKENWLDALVGTTKDYVRSFFYIVIRTVPLMLVAGFLGAAITHVWDPNTLIGTTPSILEVAGVAIFGTFLPMPIAFDIMTAQSLFAANVPIVIVITLLFTLGTFSIYSFFIIWRTFSMKLAITTYLIVSVLGMGSGYIAQAYSDHKSAIREVKYRAMLINSELDIPIPTTQKALTGTVKFLDLNETKERKSKRILDDKSLKIDRIKYKRKNTGKKPFTMLKAKHIGIDSYNQLDAP